MSVTIKVNARSSEKLEMLYTYLKTISNRSLKNNTSTVVNNQ